MDIITKEYQEVKDLALSANVITNVSVNLDLDDFQIMGEYLPLSGGTVTGDVKIDNANLSVNQNIVVNDSIAVGQHSIVLGHDCIAAGYNCIAGSKCFHILCTDSNTMTLSLDISGVTDIPDVISGRILIDTTTYCENDISILNANKLNDHILELSVSKWHKHAMERDDPAVVLWSYPTVGKYSISYSQAEGQNTFAYGSIAHAEGCGTVAGRYGHAEGYSTYASWAAHAEGHGTNAIQVASHAEGRYTTSNGYGAHAEGYQTYAANGYGAHAEGYGCSAIGTASHAAGIKACVMSSDYISYVWQGYGKHDGKPESLNKVQEYTSNGEGTFNINPVNGLSGFYIGKKNLAEILDINKHDYTAFEVFPTNEVISAGTVDNQEGVGNLLGIENYKGTGLTYSVDVPAQMACYFDFRVNTGCTIPIIIDWGDGNIQNVFETENPKISGSETKYLVSHTYIKSDKYIVKIYGKYYQLRNYCDDKQHEPIISRLFESDLPLASYIQNISSLCKKDKRLLKVNVPEQFDTAVTNIVSLFNQCVNLLDVKISNRCKFYSNRYLTASSVFMACNNLKTCNFRLPIACSDSTFGGFFESCYKLETNLEDLIPITGFFSPVVNFSRIFYSCKSLKGSVNKKLSNELTVADILWNSKSTIYTDTSQAFTNCPDALRKQIPISWGGTKQYVTPLTFTAKEAGSTISMSAVGLAPTVYLETSTTGEEGSWSDFTVGSTVITLPNVGDKVYFRAKYDNEQFATSTSDYNQFVMTGKIAASENLNTLLKVDGIDLIEKNYCYAYMFSSCSSLTQAPALPATTLANNCYQNMFLSCTSLTQAPVLPANTLANSCYNSMFKGCTALIQAPELPATDLSSSCYYGMFTNCTSLTQAPALPAETLAGYCYYAMFLGCSNLSSINVNFSAWEPTNATNYWVQSVSPSGTFTCPETLPKEIDKKNKIPSGWSVNP